MFLIILILVYKLAYPYTKHFLKTKSKFLHHTSQVYLYDVIQL